jgi:hypothetical protein
MSERRRHDPWQKFAKTAETYPGPIRDGRFLLGPRKTVKYFSVSQVARDASFMKPTRGGGGGFLHSGQRAEVVGLYSEDRVELAAKVLESNHRNQFY